MQLFIQPGGSQTFLITLICSYLKLQQRGALKIITLSESAVTANENGKLKIVIPSLVTKKGEVITETFKIIHELFNLQPFWAEFFLGANEEERQEIANIKIHLKEGKQLRKYLQKHLESRTFFVGEHLTFADLFMFTRLFDNVSQMSDQNKIQYNNLFRWFRHIQNIPEIRAFLVSGNRLLVEMPQMRLTFLEVKKGKKK